MKLTNYLHILTVLRIVVCIALLQLSPNIYSQSPADISFDINFYMMGMDSIDNDMTIAIGENVEYLNQEFEGEIQFSLANLFMDYEHEYLPVLYKEFRSRKTRNIEALVNKIETKGAINVFLFKTYTVDNSDKALLGFTPIFKARQNIYEQASPRFDRIFLAYDALKDRNTLVHEMGHFLGLKHPWELTDEQRASQGLILPDQVSLNHMTYESWVEKFTVEQIIQMKEYSIKYRSYMMQQKEIE